MRRKEKKIFETKECLVTPQDHIVHEIFLAGKKIEPKFGQAVFIFVNRGKF